MVYSRRRVMGNMAGLAVSSIFGRHLLAAEVQKAPVFQNPQLASSGVTAPATLTVAETASGSIGPGFLGFSYEKSHISRSYLRPSNRGLIALFKLLGNGLLRVGGDSTDRTIWMPNGQGQTFKQVTPRDVNQLADFVKATGWRCIYSVNLGGSADGSTSPELAADEAAYAAKQLGSSLLAIEIGNEPDAYIRPGRQYEHKEWTLATFEATWNQYRSAILAKTPGLLIAGPAAGHLEAWTIPFTRDETKDKICLLTDHYYLGNPSATFTVDTLLAPPDKRLINNLKMMREAQAVTGIPFRLGETNSYAGLSPVCLTYASAFWALDFLFTCAQGGATGINFHCGGRVQFSSICDDGTDVVSVNPEYYAMLLFAMAGEGDLHPVEVDAGTLNVTAYAVKTSKGMSIVVLNKERTQDIDLTIRLPHAVHSATLMGINQKSLGTSSPDASATSGIAIQGSSIGLDGSFSPAAPYKLAPKDSKIRCSVPALSAALIRSD